MAYNEYTLTSSNDSLLATHKVLRNTYLLLSLTLLFSAAVATFALRTNAPYLGPLPTLLGMFGLLFLTQALRNSAWGLLATFLFTGFMGYTLAPTLNFYLHNFSNGGMLIMTAFGGTGTIFLALSTYVLVTRKNFTYLGGFIFITITLAFLAAIANLFLQIPMLQLVVSSAFVLLCSGLILFHTSQIIHNGERNYISATISLYVALLNLFISLLNILSVFSGRRN